MAMDITQFDKLLTAAISPDIEPRHTAEAQLTSLRDAPDTLVTLVTEYMKHAGGDQATKQVARTFTASHNHSHQAYYSSTRCLRMLCIVIFLKRSLSNASFRGAADTIWLRIATLVWSVVRSRLLSHSLATELHLLAYTCIGAPTHHVRG